MVGIARQRHSNAIGCYGSAFEPEEQVHRIAVDNLEGSGRFGLRVGETRDPRRPVLDEADRFGSNRCQLEEVCRRIRPSRGSCPKRGKGKEQASNPLISHDYPQIVAPWVVALPDHTAIKSAAMTALARRRVATSAPRQVNCATTLGAFSRGAESPIPTLR